MNGLELSVVVPARNAAPHLRQCLAALRASSDVAREVIVVDDASDDGDRTAGAAREGPGGPARPEPSLPALLAGCAAASTMCASAVRGAHGEPACASPPHFLVF